MNVTSPIMIATHFTKGFLRGILLVIYVPNQNRSPRVFSLQWKRGERGGHAHPVQEGKTLHHGQCSWRGDCLRQGFYFRKGRDSKLLDPEFRSLHISTGGQVVSPYCKGYPLKCSKNVLSQAGPSCCLHHLREGGWKVCKDINNINPDKWSTPLHYNQTIRKRVWQGFHFKNC